jgi:hypothetical protein
MGCICGEQLNDSVIKFDQESFFANSLRLNADTPEPNKIEVANLLSVSGLHLRLKSTYMSVWRLLQQIMLNSSLSTPIHSL